MSSLIDLVITHRDLMNLDELFLPQKVHENVKQLLLEYQFRNELIAQELPFTQKILFSGPSGCGKTALAGAIAKALNKPMLSLNLSTIVDSKIGATSKNIKMLFDKAQRDKAVLFIDEFDQIGTARSVDEKDVGEMRRLVNSLLQLVDQLGLDVLLIAATNFPEALDTALVRRFQWHLRFEMPEQGQLDQYYDFLLQKYPDTWGNIERKYNCSYAEAKDDLIDQLKQNYLKVLNKD